MGKGGVGRKTRKEEGRQGKEEGSLQRDGEGQEEGRKMGEGRKKED